MVSSVYPTRSLREPVSPWRWPRRDYLLEREYRRGVPPFDRFPSVQDVVDAVLCPVAIVHKFYHGFRGALGGARGDGENIGALFHEFIALLKTDIALGRRSPDQAWDLFYGFCSERGVSEESERNLREYVSYWLRRKRRSLDELWNRRPRIFFEIHVASIRVTFEVRGRRTRYPIHGRIDELDVTNKRIVERTIRGNESAENPPFLKDFQLWLLWKIITSIDRNTIPEIWRGENFEEYELFVETPYRDFRVEKDQPLFEEWAKDALTWISDISRSTRTILEAWRNRGHHNRPCRFGDTIEECSMAYIACYRVQRRYPERRAALSASFRSLYRALFNEQLWSHDLLLYQLTIMEQDPQLGNELRRLLMGRKIFPVEIERDLGGGRFILRVSNNDLRRTLHEILQDENFEFDIIFGSFCMGIRRRAFLDFRESNLDEGRVVVRVIPNIEISDTENAYLVRGGLLLREDPWFLKRVVQRALYRLEKWGLDREDRAQRHTTIRLIDTIFGPETLRARRFEEDER